MNLSKEDQEFVKTYDDSKYAKPSVTADMVIFARGSEEEHLEVLLIQRGRPPFRGQYALPGGFVNPDESVDDAAARELKEETGVDVLPVRLLAVMDMSKHPHPAIPYYVYKFFILCELKGGSFTETFDILGKGFFRLEELPPLSLERVLPEQIQRMYAYYKHPGEDVYLD